MEPPLATPQIATGNSAGADRRRSAIIDATIERLVAEVREGIDHGYFEIHARGGDSTGGYTEVIIQAGKCFRFLIPAHCTRSARPSRRRPRAR